MKFKVVQYIKGKFIVEVEADTIDDAIEIADTEFYDSDFGVLEDIEVTSINVEG